MKTIREYTSPDGRLRFVVCRDGQDVSLGFKGFRWHTHADVLASAFGTSEELAVSRFVRDLLDDRCIIVSFYEPRRFELLLPALRARPGASRSSGWG